MSINEPKNLVEAIRYFSDEDTAFAFVAKLRWPDGQAICPRCRHNDHSFLTTRRIWKCKGCKRQFSLKVGTIFEDSPLGWDKWLPAMWLIANAKNSVSSHELGRALGVTQKSAWFMLHRIREAMQSRSFVQMSGIVEVDETYVGGEAKNMHKWQRSIKIKGRGIVYKTPVQGARSRDDGTVKATVVKTGRGHKSNVERWVEPGATVFTDQSSAYRRLDEQYVHQFVTHSREYVRGTVHTNGIENFWSLLKRALKGTQIHVDPEHLERYVVERVFAYNFRSDSDLGRMRMAMNGVSDRRLTWKELTVKWPA